MKTLDYIVNKYNLKIGKDMPIEIPNVGRDNLPEWFKDLGFKIGVEVGTQKGEYAEILCKKNPEAKLYCIDPWKKIKDYFEYRSDSLHEKYYRETKERLEKFNCELIRKTSIEAVKDFEDDSIDYVYIDGNHSFPSVVNDIYEWSKKVRKGGIISGHDWYKAKGYPKNGKNITHHVIEAVSGYTKAYKIKPWFVLGTEAKIEGQIRDKSRSWLWIKE